MEGTLEVPGYSVETVGVCVRVSVPPVDIDSPVGEVPVLARDVVELDDVLEVGDSSSLEVSVKEVAVSALVIIDVPMLEEEPVEMVGL